MFVSRITFPRVAMTAAVSLVTVFLLSCAPDTSNGVPLTGGWEYAAGSLGDTPAVAEKHSFKPLEKPVRLELLVPGGSGILWLRRAFSIPESLAAEDLSVYLGTILPVDRTYCNGIFIGGHGAFPRNEKGDGFFSDWNRVRVYHLPAGSLKKEGNVILVKIFVHYEGALDGTPFVGKRDHIEVIQEINELTRFYLNLVVTFILLSIGIYLLVIYLLNVDILENLYYAAACLLFPAFLLNFYIVRLPGNIEALISYTAWQKIAFGTTTASFLFLVRFAAVYLEHRPSRLFNTVTVFVTAVPAAAIFLLPDYRSVVAFAKLMLSGAAVATIVLIMVLSIMRRRERPERARVLYFAFVPFALCALFDIVYHVVLGKTDSIYLSGIGISGYIIATGFGIAGTFVRYYMHVRELNAALKRSEERYRGVVERNFDIIYTMNRRGEMTYMSPAVTRVTGYAPEELLGMKYFSLVPANEMEKVRSLFRSIMKGDDFDIQEVCFLARDGGLLYMEVALSPIVEDGVITGMQGIAHNVTERKRVEYALSLEKERLAVTLDSIAEAVIATDTDGVVITVNRVAEELTGLAAAAVLGRPIGTLLEAVDSDSSTLIGFILGRIQSGGDRVDAGIQRMVFRRDRKERYFASSAATIRAKDRTVVGFVIVLRDVTDDIVIQDEILKVKKLESMGVLAGGIAHDFNNILTAILGNISLARLSLPADPAVASGILSDAEKAVVEAEGLTRQLLTFSRGGAPVKTLATVEDLINDSARFVLRGSRARLNLNFHEGLKPVSLDRGQFSQVIQNLVINADQAMPGGGEICISARNIDAAAAAALPGVSAPSLEITVSDTGSGIEPHLLTKIFDPYFTTKKNGTGLGLASAYSIIKKHGGQITVDSEPGKGSTFRIYLPCQEGRIVPKAEEVKGLFRGRGSVLVMDDDPIVRNTLRKMLEHLGFVTAEASDGMEAVEIYRSALEKGEPFAAVILDLTIPGGMGGRESMAVLKERDPAVTGIVSSGYSNDDVMANYREYGFKGVIAKPYTMEDLSRIMRELVGPGDQAPAE